MLFKDMLIKNMILTTYEIFMNIVNNTFANYLTFAVNILKLYLLVSRT